ncbi:MAG: MFS transporter [Haloarculaceae archaeon]
MGLLDALFGKDAAVVADTDFQLLLLANVTAPLGIALISPILDTLTGPFGVSATQIGLLVSLMSAPGIVVIPLVGFLSDRYGRKAVLTAGLLLFGVAGVAISFTTSFHVVLALRLLQGFGFAGIVPVIITSVGDMYEGGAEATAQGLRFSISGVSLVVFPVLAGVLIAFGWQYPFLLYGIAVPLAAMIALWFDEPTDDAPAAAEATPAHADETPVRDVLRLASRPRVLAVLVGRGLPVVVWTAFLTYNSMFVVRVLGGTPQDAGLLVGAGAVTFAGAASQAGRVTAAFESRAGPLLGANVCLAGGFGLVAVAPTLLVAGAGAVATGAGFGILLALYRSSITGLAPERIRGGLVSSAESLGRVAATGTPILLGAAVGALRPAIGFGTAVRWTNLGAAVLVGVLGIACLAVGRDALEGAER